ncbi:MAG: DinB family protein, partial [Bacteroidota bacterium]|nr:DinB family protein [Bacteroidota bacterium]
MNVEQPIQALLWQLRETLQRLTDRQYAAQAALLSGATVGQHVRHIIEFFEELIKSYDDGTVNYDRRKRDHVLETDRSLAIDKLADTALAIDKPDKDLLLVAHLSSGDSEPVFLRTNYFRELLYHIEHTVHHMALLRIGINEVAEIVLPANFGVAAST